MKIGVPREIKAEEYRVGMTPLVAQAVAARGHQVLVESGCTYQGVAESLRIPYTKLESVL